MSGGGTGTRTKSGEKARAKSTKAAAKTTKATKTTAAKSTRAASKTTETATRAAVRSGAATAPPRRTRTVAAPEPEARRRRGRVLAIGLAVLVGLGVLAFVVARSPLLDVESVQVTGVVGERALAAQEAAGVAVGDPVLGVFAGRAAGRVEDLAWVREAHVSRALSGTVRIEVVPRTPVGFVAAGQRFLVVDADGTVIEKVDTPPAGVPELVGVADVAPVGGRIAPPSLPAAAGALGAELRMRVAGVALDDGAVTAQIIFGPQLRFGNPDRMAVKARVAAAVLASLGDTPVGYVDVSVPAAPVSG